MPNPIPGSGLPGSPSAPAAPAIQAAPVGQAPSTGGAVDYEKAYKELETRLGTQGQEVGEYRQFFQNIAPLLDKLDKAPELVQAIIDGKVDASIAKAVMENRVDVRDVATVTAAHEQVKEKLGEKAYEAASPEAVTKLVEAEVGRLRREIEEKSDLQDFQDYTQKFMDKTPDFQEYSAAIDKWLDSHDVTDVEVAYYAVKGQMSVEAAKKAADIAAADRAKDVLANAGGGGQSSQYTVDGTPLIDKLIAGRPNPNAFSFGQ